MHSSYRNIPEVNQRTQNMPEMCTVSDRSDMTYVPRHNVLAFFSSLFFIDILFETYPHI